MREVLTVLVVMCGGVVAVASAIGVLWWLLKPRVADWAEAQIMKPIRETHHQVTVNHHSSEEPTVLDKIADVERAVQRVSLENAEQARAIGRVQTNVTALTVVLDAHLKGSDIAGLGDEDPDLD